MAVVASSSRTVSVHTGLIICSSETVPPGVDVQEGSFILWNAKMLALGYELFR